MAQSFTTDSLITSVKRRATIPENQALFSTQDFIDFANEEMIMSIVPEVMRLHEDYFLISDDVALVANQSRYRIPERAIGNMLRDLSFVDNSGNVLEMTRLSIDDTPEFNLPFTQNRLSAYHVEANQIVLQPAISGTVSGSLRFSYYLRPNNLVTEDRVGIITSINTSTGELTLDKTPSVFSVTETFDIVEARSPNFTIAKEINASSINTTTNIITFAISDLPTDLKVGDHICLKTECIIPQIPSDLHVYLAHKIAMRCLEAMGDAQGIQLAEKKSIELENKLTNIIDNRVQASPQKVVNRRGILRTGLYRRRFRYRG
jgi:hypothetical protein